MTPEERRAYVRDHRTAILGYSRKSHGPAMSAVYFALDEASDTILVSTMRDRLKARVVARNPKVSLCILDENYPLNYLQVYCDAEIDHDPDHAIDTMLAIAKSMAHDPLGTERPTLAAGVDAEGEQAVQMKSMLDSALSGGVNDGAMRAFLGARAAEENRVTIRLHPYETFETPPSHTSLDTQFDTTTERFFGTSLPWRDPSEG